MLSALPRHNFAYDTHLVLVVELLHAVVGRYKLVQKHWPPFSVHDIIFYHLVDRFANIPAVRTFPIQKTFDSSRALIEASPDATTRDQLR